MDTSQPSITMFYNELKTIGAMYDIFLIPFDNIANGQPLHESGFLATPTLIGKMSAQLFYKLKQPGVLPGNITRFRSLIKSHARTNDGFELLTQILRPYLPALQDGVSSTVPNWIGCDDDIYLAQMRLTNYYNIEHSLARIYTPMEQSRKFLELAKQSDKFKEAAKYYDRKLEDLGGRDIIPPRNLLLTNIANTVEIQVNNNKPPADDEIDIPTINKATGAFSDDNNHSGRPPISSHGSRTPEKRFPAPPHSSSLSNPLDFKPKRFNEQCQACKKYGHRSNSCFILAQIYFAQKFIQLYPDYVKNVATAYAAHNDKSQRTPTVRVLRSVPNVAQMYTEDDMMFHLTSDEIFATECVQPPLQE